MKDSYQYVDENAKALFRVVVDRTDPKNKSVYQQGFLNGRYENTMEGVRRVPYQLPMTLDAINRNQPVYIVEGERDVHTLMDHDLYATTNAGGALKWSDDYSQLLSGGRFVVLCDNDDIGRQHAHAVIESLREHADPMSVKFVDVTVLMPELAPIKGADVTDFIERGGTIEQLLSAVKRAPELAEDVAAGPTYPEIDVRNLPAPLRQIVEASTPGQDAMTALLASITSSGAVMPNVSVVVGGICVFRYNWPLIPT